MVQYIKNMLLVFQHFGRVVVDDPRPRDSGRSRVPHGTGQAFSDAGESFSLLSHPQMVTGYPLILPDTFEFSNLRALNTPIEVIISG